jgi:hypothetical protein
MRILSGVMFVVFLICIVFQYKNPDPIEWMFLYAVPAFFSLMYVLGRKYLWLTLLLFVIYVVAAMYWCPPLDSVADNILEDDEVLEAGGLLFSGIWMGILSLASRVPHSSDAAKS